MDRLRSARRRRRLPTFPFHQGSVRYQGQVTRAGSRALEDRRRRKPCARRGATARRCALVVIGPHQHDRIRPIRHRHNPHYGTPKSVWRATPAMCRAVRRRVPRSDRRRHGLWRAWHRHRHHRRIRPPITASSATSEPRPLDSGVPLSFTLDSFGPLANRRLLRHARRRARRALYAGPAAFHQGPTAAVPNTVALDDPTMPSQNL